MKNSYTKRKNIVARRKLGLDFRRTLIKSLPATVYDLVEMHNKGRSTILHHLYKLEEEYKVWCDTATRPYVWRIRRDAASS